MIELMNGVRSTKEMSGRFTQSGFGLIRSFCPSLRIHASIGRVEIVPAISEIGANLGVLFDTQQQINNHYLELEEASKTNYDPAQNTSQKAIERALIELQLEKLMEQTREAMVYAPPELKDLYSRFLKMHQKIEREQEWARAETIRRTRLARWKQEQEEIRFIELVSSGVAVVFISMFFGWVMWQLRNLSAGY